MVGRWTASQIASATAASFFWLFTTAHKLTRHQPNIMSKGHKLSSPIVGRVTASIPTIAGSISVKSRSTSNVQTVTQSIVFPSVLDYVRFQLLATPDGTSRLRPDGRFRITSTVDGGELKSRAPSNSPNAAVAIVWCATGARSRYPAPSLETPHAQPASSSDWYLSYSTGSLYIPQGDGRRDLIRRFHNQYALLR